MRKDEVTIKGADGKDNTFALNDMTLIKAAHNKGITFRQHVNTVYPTAAGDPDAFTQMCVSAGLRFKADDTHGVPAANLADMFDPEMAAPYDSQPSVPASRILFMPAIMEVIENKLQSKEDVATGAFEGLVGYKKTVATNKIEQPVLDFTGAGGPEDAQFQRVAQNARPPIVLSFKSSDISRKIPTTSIGMEISREALQSNSLDIIALTLGRFFKLANYNEWVTNIGYLLSGDPDGAVNSMSAGTSALPTFTAQSLDSGITAAGVMSQDAYLAYLYKNSLSMTKTHLITDFAGTRALENRTNRPTNVENNSTDRMDAPFKIIYPVLQESLGVLVMPEGTWPANTYMGLDHESAIAKVTSTFAEYEAIEEVVMKKSTELRIDRGFITYRIFDSAFNVMVLTV